jgi:cytosine/uracil/thiamine/allantoin permease
MDVILLVIELGDFQLRSATPWSEVGWFVGGLLLLAGLSFLVLRWNRRAGPDPFA